MLDQIRVVTFQDGETWVAQCLEVDIAAHAPDLDTLHIRLHMALEAEREESVRRHGRAFAGIDPAPRRFHDMWDKSAGDYSPRALLHDRDDAEKWRVCA